MDIQLYTVHTYDTPSHGLVVRYVTLKVLLTTESSSLDLRANLESAPREICRGQNRSVVLRNQNNMIIFMLFSIMIVREL